MAKKEEKKPTRTTKKATGDEKPKAKGKASGSKTPTTAKASSSKSATPAKTASKKGAPPRTSPASGGPVKVKRATDGTKSDSSKPRTSVEKATVATAPTSAPKRAKAPEAPPSAKTAVPRIPQAAVVEDKLPHEYGRTKIVLLLRDPEWLFAYWEIDAETRRSAGIVRGKHERKLVLRVYEDGPNSALSPYFDIEASDETSSWYIHARNPNSRVTVALGLYDSTGEFREITRSSAVQLPRMGIAESADLQFAEITDEIYGQIVELSGGARIGDRLGSDEFLRSLQSRILESLHEGPLSSGVLSSGEFFGLSSVGLSSGLFSGQFGGASEFLSSWLLPSSLSSIGEGGEDSAKRGLERDRRFWLEVGVDVIVYGATEPNARVTFMGKPIALTPDGTFRFRMVLPDTEVEFPVEAVSADGAETRRVKPVVKRHTEGNPHEPVE